MHSSPISPSTKTGSASASPMVLKSTGVRPLFRPALLVVATLVVLAVFVVSGTFAPSPFNLYAASTTASPMTIELPPSIKKVHVNIGPNLGPLIPPEDDESVAVLAVEANTGVANYLREKFQKTSHPFRFFVLHCAIAGPPYAGAVSTFRFYNANGKSSSLSQAGKTRHWTNTSSNDPSQVYGPGPAGVDFVTVISLDNLLKAIPSYIEIPFLKTDTQGHDLSIIKSASLEQLHRVPKIMSETYVSDWAAGAYQNNESNKLEDWIPYMRSVGYRLSNPPSGDVRTEYDAVWIRE